MTTYLVKRIAVMIPTFFAVSLIVFFIINVAPGQPGAVASQDGTEEATGSGREAYRVFKSQFNLDKPILLNFRYRVTQAEVEEHLSKALNKGKAFRPSDQMRAIEWIEDLGRFSVPHLLAIAETSPDRDLQRLALKTLSENAQRPMKHTYGQKATEAERAYNNQVQIENERLRALAPARGKELDDDTHGELLAGWKTWYQEVEATRFQLSEQEKFRILFFETRFALYWWKLLHLDFGISHIDKKPVLGKILGKLKYSLTLAVPSLVLAYLIAIPLGIFSSVRRDTIEDKTVSVILFMLYSLPSFFIGTLLLATFSMGSDYPTLHWFPTGGWQGTNFPELTLIGKVKDVIWHLCLPLLCMSYGSLAALSRYARTGLLEVINADYIRTARAKGVPESMVIMKHVVRNGMIPVITLMGTILPVLIGGSVIIEVIFGIPGMGLMSYEAILQRDYNVIMAVQLISAILVMLGILLADILYAIVDPRISYS